MENTPLSINDFIVWADEATIRKNWPEASKRWTLMRGKYPEHLRGYVGGVIALKENKEFKAAESLVLEGLEKFPKETELYIEYGDIAARQKNWVEAIKRWALMREKCPQHPRGYYSAATALREHGDFEASEALIFEGLKKFPQEQWLYFVYGTIAMRQENWEEAAKRWALMREKCPQKPQGYIFGAKALKEQKNFKTAEFLVLEGLEKFPKEIELYIEYGDIAMRQENWEEAAKRWALMREKCPQKPQGYISGVKALKEQKDFRTAEILVLEGLEKFPKETELYIEYGDIAMRQENWEEAAKRWALMREKCPHHPRGYYSAAIALKEQGKFTVADTLVAEGMKKFPKEPELYKQYGDIAVRQKNWEEAAKRWALMREKCPGHPLGYIGEEAALKEIWNVEEDEIFVFGSLEKIPTNYIPKVSVIVPLYNPRGGFDRCLASLLSQTLADIEMIFVDDLGTDDTMDKVRAVAVEDSRIRIITNSKNLGAGPSRNRGIETARGEYLSFVNADDYVSSDFLELLYNKAHTEQLDIVKGSCVREGGGFFQQKSFLNDTILSGLAAHRSLYNLFLYEHCTGLYRRAFLMESGARYGSSCDAEDAIFLLRACHAAQTFGIEDRATYHYVYKNFLARNTFDAQRLRNQLDSLKEQTDYLVEHVPRNSDVIFYTLRHFNYALALHTYATTFPKLGTAAAEYLSGIREQVLRLPYLEDLKNHSFVFRSLVDFNVGLSIAPLSDSWRKLDDTRAYMDLVKRWCDFALAHPELADEYGGDLQQVLRHAADAVALKTQYGPQINVKIFGAKNSSMELLNVSDVNAWVSTPVWLYKLHQPGPGYVIEPYCGQTAITLDFVCKTAGEFTATLSGADIRDGNGKQIPKWVVYTGLICNGEIVFEGEKQIWHDQPYCYKKPVQAGDTVKLEICWRDDNNVDA